jgi:hypothetical protein
MTASKQGAVDDLVNLLTAGNAVKNNNPMTLAEIAWKLTVEDLQKLQRAVYERLKHGDKGFTS